MTDADGARLRWWRRSLWVWPALLLALVLGFGVYLARELPFDAPEAFWRQKGELVNVQTRPLEGDADYAAYGLTLESSAGYRVRGHLRVPRAPGRWPVLIILGGVQTGRLAAELVTPDSPYVILGLDYPWEGSTRLSFWEGLIRILAIRRAMLRTPSAVFLAIDYLETRPEVALDRDVVLAGASFGAQLATVAGALDERIGPVLLLYGGGDLTALLHANLEDVRAEWLRWSLASAGAWLLEPVEPLNYVAEVSPGPTILINGVADDRIPAYCVGVLYEAARPPKQLIWLNEGHISSRDPELLRRVLVAATTALAELEQPASETELSSGSR